MENKFLEFNGIWSLTKDQEEKISQLDAKISTKIKNDNMIKLLKRDDELMEMSYRKNTNSFSSRSHRKKRISVRKNQIANY